MCVEEGRMFVPRRYYSNATLLRWPAPCSLIYGYDGGEASTSTSLWCNNSTHLHEKISVTGILCICCVQTIHVWSCVKSEPAGLVEGAFWSLAERLVRRKTVAIAIAIVPILLINVCFLSIVSVCIKTKEVNSYKW